MARSRPATARRTPPPNSVRADTWIFLDKDDLERVEALGAVLGTSSRFATLQRIIRDRLDDADTKAAVAALKRLRA